MVKWQILYLRTRYRSKLGWFFWFGPIHVTIRCNLAARNAASGLMIVHLVSTLPIAISPANQYLEGVLGISPCAPKKKISSFYVNPDQTLD